MQVRDARRERTVDGPVDRRATRRRGDAREGWTGRRRGGERVIEGEGEGRAGERRARAMRAMTDECV